MLQYWLKRIGLLIPAFLGITIVAFAFVRVLPGYPVLLMAGERGIAPERYQQLMHEYGYDQPLWKQYFDYLGKLFHGDLGSSIVTKKPVLSEFMTLFPATVELFVTAMIIALVIGIPAGMIGATRRGTLIDQTITGTALVGYSMPIFWWGPLLIIIFSMKLDWTPLLGRIDLVYDFPSHTGFMLIDSLLSGQEGAFASVLGHLILPSIVLATIPMAVIARQTRSAMLEVLGEDYVRTARAKGLSPFRVVAIHALRNALIPIITVIGLMMGRLLAGEILTETIFFWPGIGKWMIDSILQRDYPVVQSGLLLIAAVVLVVNLAVDLTYGLINPRISH